MHLDNTPGPGTAGLNLGSGMDQTKIVDWHGYLLLRARARARATARSKRCYPICLSTSYENLAQPRCSLCSERFGISVYPCRSCEQDPTQLVTDLGNDDAVNATDATAQFMFSEGGPPTDIYVAPPPSVKSQRILHCRWVVQGVLQAKGSTHAPWLPHFEVSHAQC